MTESEPAAPGQIGASGLRSYQQTRKMPPPRHPKRIFPVPEPEPEITEPPVIVAVPDQEPEAEESEPVGEPEPDPEPVKIVATKQGSGKKKKEPEIQASPTVRDTPTYTNALISLDDKNDAFLNGVTGTATIKGYKNISKNAVVRFALSRLEADMTYQEVVDAMLAGKSSIRPVGRPRG